MNTTTKSVPVTCERADIESIDFTPGDVHKHQMKMTFTDRKVTTFTYTVAKVEPPRFAFFAALYIEEAFGPNWEHDYGIGMAMENQPGWKPCPKDGGFDTYEEAESKADDLNADIGLSKKEAIRIVLSSMAHKKEVE